MIEVLKSNSGTKLKGVLHCFSGNATQAEQLVALGFYLGIGGVVTFKNSGLKEAIKDIPMEKLLLETDCPYLAPVPFRGKRNEPSYLVHIAEFIANLRGFLSKISRL